MTVPPVDRELLQALHRNVWITGYLGGVTAVVTGLLDAAPATVYAKLHDEGVYLASVPTMYRILREHDEAGDRRRHATHPARVKPGLVATRPNQVYTWDITKLHGPVKWTYYYLSVTWNPSAEGAVGRRPSSPARIPT